MTESLINLTYFLSPSMEVLSECQELLLLIENYTKPFQFQLAKDSNGKVLKLVAEHALHLMCRLTHRQYSMYIRCKDFEKAFNCQQMGIGVVQQPAAKQERLIIASDFTSSPECGKLEKGFHFQLWPVIHKQFSTEMNFLNFNVPILTCLLCIHSVQHMRQMIDQTFQCPSNAYIFLFIPHL